MYRLLVVDDLPVIVDGMLELFEQTEHLDLEVMKAYSGEEALELLALYRIDVVLSDIKMTGIEGIELLEEIKKQWPACKVIFLTGYNDFSYAKSAITLGAFDYLLKVESDDKIVDAVERAIKKIEEEQDQAQMIIRAQSKMRKALPSLQKEYMWGMFQGRQLTEEQLREAFAEMDIPLDVNLPVYLLIGRIDAWKEMVTAPDKALLAYAFQNVGDEYLSAHVRSFSLVFEMSKIVWIIQPKAAQELSDHTSPAWGRTHRFTSGILETIQSTCSRLLSLSVSFMLGSQTVPWKELSDRFYTLKYGLTQGHGLFHEVIMTDADIKKSETADKSYNDSYLQARIQLLSSCLENNHHEQFNQLFSELTQIWSSAETSSERKVELYHSLSAVFLSYLHKNYELREYLNTHMDLDLLFRQSDSVSWDELVDDFWQIANSFLEWQTLKGTELPAEVINKVHKYIEENMSGDISLTAIADHVSLNPSYLSRLYKQMTGIGLSKYLNDYRNVIAKDLLLNSSLKVNEIAFKLGYNSGLAFIRFFKKQNEMTPQDFRSMRSHASSKGQ